MVEITITKSLLNTILDVHENAEMYDKKEVLLTLLEHDSENSYIIDELNDLGCCSCGGELETKSEYQSCEYFGSVATERVSTTICTNCSRNT